MDYPFKTNLMESIDKPIYFKAWTTKIEKQFLLVKDDNLTTEELFELLIPSSIDNKEIYKLLSYYQKLLLLIEIRKQSIGTDFSVNYTCDCGFLNDVVVEIDDMLSFKKENNNEYFVADNIKIKFCKQKDNLKKYIIKDDNIIEQNFVEFVISVDEIYKNNELIKGYSYQELYDFIEDLPSKTFDKLYAYYKNTRETLDIELKTSCMKCKKEEVIEVSSIEGFFWEV